MTFLKLFPLSLFIPMLICYILIILLTGFEYAFLASNKLTIELKRSRGNAAGRLLGSFFDSPHKFWSATIIGFYILLFGFCYFLTELTNHIIDIFKFQYIWAHFLYNNFFVLLVIDFLIASMLLLFGIGFFAKRSFEAYPEGKLNTWSHFIQFLSSLIAPIAEFFVGLSKFVLEYLFNIKTHKRESVYNRVNPYHFFRRSMQGQFDLDESNKELFEKMLQLTETKVRKCMTPRNEIIGIPVQSAVNQLKDLFIHSKLSYIIVYEKHLDNILGYVHDFDLIQRPENIQQIMHNIPVVPETMNAMDLIQKFTKEKESVAWVIDEFGGTAGIITLEAALEEVFGDISEEDSMKKYVETKINEQEFIFSGRLEIDYLNDKYNLDIPTHETETLSGYIIAQYGSVPKINETIIIDHFAFEILMITQTRVETTKLRVLK